MQSEYHIKSNAFEISIQGLTLVEGNQFHICSGNSDYGLYNVVIVEGNTYTTSSIAQKATFFSGTTMAFIIALSVILTWILTGSLFNFSDTWQLVINTGTTIITFLMVFLIQRTQNKDSRALHLKLNELIASLKGSSNRLVDIENLSEGELETLHKFYQKLAQLAKSDKDLLVSHSIDEAHELHKEKINK